MPFSEEEKDRVSKAVKDLSEYFDSVQIFVNKYENNEVGTCHFSDGNGNWFAIYGQIRNWINHLEEKERHHTRKAEDEK